MSSDRVNNISFIIFFIEKNSNCLKDKKNSKSRREGTIFHSALPLWTVHEHSEISQLCMWDEYHIFNRTAYIYQSDVRWYLAPYRISIICWWCGVKFCLFTCWLDFRSLLQKRDMGNLWTQTRICYHICITSVLVTKRGSHTTASFGIIGLMEVAEKWVTAWKQGSQKFITTGCLSCSWISIFPVPI